MVVWESFVEAYRLRWYFFKGFFEVLHMFFSGDILFVVLLNKAFREYGLYVYKIKIGLSGKFQSTFIKSSLVNNMFEIISFRYSCYQAF